MIPRRPTHRSVRRRTAIGLGLAAAAGLVATTAGTGPVAADDTYQCSVDTATSPVATSFVGRYSTGLTQDQIDDEITSAEIVAIDGSTLYVLDDTDVDVVDVSTPGTPTRTGSLPLPGSPTSVAVSDGLVAVSVPAEDKTEPGQVLFFQGTTLVGVVGVGSLPDIVTFTPDGKTLLVANEGEPNSYRQADSVDPEGSISVIQSAPFRAPGRFKAKQPLVKAADDTIDFTDFNVGGARHSELSPGVRIFGPGATVAQDLEPEYITLSADGRTAWVSLQENNAIARIDVRARRVTSIAALGTVDHSLPGNGLDPSDRDGGVAIANWPVQGMFMPDGIAAARIGGADYALTANEGDARDWPGITPNDEEVQRARSIADPAAFPQAARPSGTSTPTNAQLDAQLGRLRVSPFGPGQPISANPGIDKLTTLYSFGTRSFSIRDAAGNLVWDSGDDLECLTADQNPAWFNADNAEDVFDVRSDDKGPEPEAVAVGQVDGATLAFVALERIGGVVVYDISDPTAPVFHRYLQSRTFGASGAAAQADSGPEGMVFVPAAQSPNGEALLFVGNEVTGSVAIWQIG
jgi:DNA-binding beta-propeller fold protein YncE